MTFPLKNFDIYQNILGEQVARAVQARRGATRVPGLFGLDKLYDVEGTFNRLTKVLDQVL